MFKYILLFCLLSKTLLAQDYFIRLSDTGLNYKSQFLINQLESISNFDNSALLKASDIKFHEILPAKSKIKNFDSWLVLQAQANSQQIIDNLAKNRLIDFFEPVGHFKIDFESNDSLSSEQWYLDKINVKDAWTITKGNSNIIICIIDTGMDFVHPDLQPAIWVNTAEDLNGNGFLDEQDINNIDDDENGFVDDVVGWDFTDAPRFVDAGDYLDEDNEPWDEFSSGHGTQAAGIIAAQDNNTIGIAGIAPGVKIMNLRAGTANGYLEEDDVGRAILYALQNGAKIINMSFGDTALSRFLKDVILYAADQGIIFVASSGNSSSSEPHYPSALAQVISVGASTQNDGIAGFSNYGNSIDLVAPGSEIMSTAIGGKYNSVGGTSFSAPIVSAVAGLVLSNNNDISADQMRNILKTSADDIYYEGWDSLSALGRVSAYNALKIPASGILKITSPQVNSSTAVSEIVVIGSAAHPDLVSTEISLGIGTLPEDWTILRTLNGQQIIDDTLAVFKPQAGDTFYTIKIVMNLFNSASDEIHHSFNLDRSSPVITHVKTIDLWDGPEQSVLITFDTDDICSATLYVRPKNSTESFTTLVSPYETINHRFKIDKTQFNGEFEFYLQARNNSALSTIDDNNGSLYTFSLNKEIKWKEFTEVKWTLPSGFILDKVTDFDHDGNSEIVISRYDENSGFGPIEVYEFNNGQFNLRLLTGFSAIPRAAGDVDQDGKSDLLLGFGQNSFLFESNSPDSFPSQLIWQDTVNFWAAAYSDLDNDNLFEITGRVDQEYVILENNADNSFTEIARLSNPSSGENRFGVPSVELTDLNNDGVNEIIFGDYDGDLIAYSSDGDNIFNLLAAGKTIHANASEIFSSDANGSIFTATHTSDDFSYEHEFDARYWSIESFKKVNDKLNSLDTINTFGFADTRDFNSGLAYHNFDDQSLLYVSFFPHLYIFKKEAGQWSPVWYSGQARSNTVLVYDFDKDGNDEFYFNNGENIVGYSAVQSERPLAPFSFSANPVDSITISLSWQEVSNASQYNIYRGQAVDNLEYLLETANHTILDSINVGQKYYYAVTSIDSSYQIAESFYSIDSVQTASPPKYTGYEFSGDRQVLIHFDKRIQINQQLPALISRASLKDFASSLIITNKKSLLVSFSEPFIAGVNDTLFIENVFGETGVPITKKSQTIGLLFTKEEKAPYVKNSNWISERQMMIVFSEPMDFKGGLITLPVTPSGSTKKVTIADSSYTSIIVDFTSDTYIGATGQPSYLLLDGIVSKSGIALDGISSISLYKEMNGLKDVKIYPQPVKPKHDELIFANLPGDVKITIYNMNGRPVKHLSGQTEFGGLRWNLKDDLGNNVAAGVYVYDMHWNNKSEQGKIVIVR